MNTHDFEIHRAIVHSSDPVTGMSKVRIPSLLGAGLLVDVPPTGLSRMTGVWNVPPAGTSTFVAVSVTRTDFLWVVGAERDYPPVESYQVSGGSAGSPVTGTPLFTGHFVRNGDLVYFDVQVDFDNITNFGTGQYYLTLPFPCHEAVMIRGGCLHDNDTGLQYHISGHANKGTSTLELFTTDLSGQRLNDFAFTSTEPVTLTTADNFHIQGSYIAEPI